MTVKPGSQVSSRWGSIAFGVVMLGSYLMWLSGGGLTSDPILLAVVTLVALGYWGLGTWGEEHIHALGLAWLTGIYFVVQLALGGLVTFLTGGQIYLMLLPIASQAVERLSGRWAVAMCAAVWTVLVLPITLQNGPQNFWSWGAPILAAVVFVAAFTQMMVGEQKARAALAEANQKLRQYAAQVEELATIQERNRLAREIHDGLGHYLTAINIQIKAAQALVGQDPDLEKEALGNAQKLAEEALGDVRRSISSLRSDPSTGRPLPEILAALLEETRRTGMQAELSVEGAAGPLPPQVDFTFYRAAQEGLTNVHKHAQASRVNLVLSYRASSVRLLLQDNGAGAGDTRGGFGLTGLQERVEMVGGTMKMNTAPGQGFILEVEIPRVPKV